MIQANELRIGNNLCFYKPEQIEPQILTITGICEDNGIYYVFSNEYAAINLTSGLMPIHLTPKILESCGFEKSMYKDAEQWLSPIIIRHQPHEEYQIGIMKRHFGFTYEATPCKILIQSLHQLQNLYFALTDEELHVNFHYVATSFC